MESIIIFTYIRRYKCLSSNLFLPNDSTVNAIDVALCMSWGVLRLASYIIMWYQIGHNISNQIWSDILCLISCDVRLDPIRSDITSYTYQIGPDLSDTTWYQIGSDLIWYHVMWYPISCHNRVILSNWYQMISIRNIYWYDIMWYPT